MKQLFTLLATLLVTTTLWAQSPEKMSYQAVIRKNGNALVTNTPVGMKISILQGSASGSAVYSEIQTPTTNANGLISIEIGGAGFDAIDWSTGPFFILTETDPTGGTNYTITGTSQLLSVPYALHSKTAESITGGIIETDPVFVASPANVISTGNIANWNTAYGWQNHATEGYMKSFTETDPVWNAASANYYTKTNLQTSGASQLHFNNLTNKPTSVAGYGILDAMTTAHATYGITLTNISNWNSAFSWGNHALEGYLTSEVDGSITNELQTLSIKNDTVSLSNGGFVKLPATSWTMFGNTSTNSLTNFIGTTDATDFIIRTNNTERMRISSAGKIGIGVNNSTFPLEVRVPSSGGSQINLKLTNLTLNTGSGVGILFAPDDAAIAKMGIFVERRGNWGVGTMHFLSRTTSDYASADISNSVMSITQNGNVGIGTTNPGNKLDVNGVISATGGNSTNWNTAYGWGDHTTAGYLKNYTETDPKIGTNTAGYSPKWNGTTLVTGAIFQDATGNVGIGTTNPGGVLDVAGGFIRVQASDNVPTGNVNALEMGYFTTGGYAFLQGYNRGTGTFLPIEFSGSTVGFRANGTTAIKILTNGNVGIGTSSPGAKLEVNGQIKITGGTSTQFLKADGSLDANTYSTAVREVADEFSAAASQSSFTLSKIPSSNSKVKMYINGVRISNTAYSNTGTSLTYTPANNGSYNLVAGDRIQFDYYY